MSKFERSDASGAWADARELQFPEDFLPEEAAFARQMRDLFALDDEEAPPLFVQTLLEQERFRIPSESFEQRVVSEVFGSLRLEPDAPDPLHRHNARRSETGTRTPGSRGPSLGDRVRSLLLTTFQYANRPLAMGSALFMLLMVLAVTIASPSLAQGLRDILGNTGVVQVTSPPTASSPPASYHKAAGAAQHQVDFDPSMPLFWPGSLAGHYTYEGTQLLQPTQWSEGAIVDLQYGLIGTSAGSGTLDIREFEVGSAYSAVLQVVEAGYATSVTLSNGDPAVYVSGMWQQRLFDHTITATWQTGTHCLLIMERQGVVIWMEGDPRDGLNAQTMTNIANQLVSVNQATLMGHHRDIWLIGASLAVSLNNPTGSEYYLLVPQGISPESGVGQFVFSGLTSGTSIGTGPGN